MSYCPSHKTNASGVLVVRLCTWFMSENAEWVSTIFFYGDIIHKVCRILFCSVWVQYNT